MAKDIPHRVIVAQATLDEFKGKEFELGSRDCAKMVAFHLKAMGAPIPHAKSGAYKSPLSARRALKRLGHKSLIDLMDAHFPRVPSSRALTGDIMAFEAEEGSPIGSLAIYLGNGLVLNYVEGCSGAVAGRIKEPPLAAWDVW